MAFEYLRELKGRLTRGEPLPMSEDCLSEYTDAIKQQFVELAPDFERNDNEERSRMFFVYLSLVDESLAKDIFDKVYDKDENAVTYLCHNFNPNFVFPESIEEITKYIPEQRMPELTEKTEGAIRNMLLGAVEYNARKPQ